MSITLNNLQFEMIGYKLLEINYTAIDSDLFNNFTLKFSKVITKNKIATLDINILLGFEKEKEALFSFEFAFLYNNESLYKKMDEYEIIKKLSIEAFPFIRNSIFNVTKESTNSIMLPIVDLNNLDFGKGVKFSKV